MEETGVTMDYVSKPAMYTADPDSLEVQYIWEGWGWGREINSQRRRNSTLEGSTASANRIVDRSEPIFGGMTE